MEFLFVFAVGLVAGTVSGTIGTGASIMLLPVLIYAFGPKEAVPIMAVGAVMANLGRILVWWREVDWRACAAYAVTGVPAAALGARTLLALPSRAVDITIGVFLILMIPVRRLLAARDVKLSLWHLALAGAIIGYLTGIVASTGPINVPVFLAYGLVKGPFIATEGAGSLAVFISKAIAFQRLGALPSEVAMKGLLTGSSLMIGAFIAKHFVARLHADSFRYMMDALMLVSGLSILWQAFAHAP